MIQENWSTSAELPVKKGCHVKALQKRFHINITDSTLLDAHFVQKSNKQTKICDIRAFPLHSTADRKPDLTRNMFPTRP